MGGATLGSTVAVTAYWSYVLLGRTPDYQPWLRTAVLVTGIVGALGLLLASRLGRRLALAAVGLGLAASLAGPAAYTLSTLNTGHQGSIVTAGPSSGGMGGPGGGGGGRGGRGGGPGGGMRFPGQGNQQGGQQGNVQGGQQGGGMGQPPTGTPPGQGQGQSQGQGQGQGQMPGWPGASQNGQRPGAMPGAGEGFGGAGMGGLLNGASVGTEAEALLEKDAGDYTWAAAAIGSQNAASYQLATGDPVMAIGGFNGSDPSPTLAQFKRYVEDGRIHYFIAGGGMGGGRMGGDSGSSSQIASWVEKNFEKVTAGSATFYDLTRPTDGA